MTSGKSTAALEKALEWYAERARSLERYTTAKPAKIDAIGAVVQELALDAGRRAVIAKEAGHAE